MKRKEQLIVEVVSAITVLSMLVFMLSLIGIFLCKVVGASYDVVSVLQIALACSSVVGIIVAFIATYKNIPLSDNKEE